MTTFADILSGETNNCEGDMPEKKTNWIPFAIQIGTIVFAVGVFYAAMQGLVKKVDDQSVQITALQASGATQAITIATSGERINRLIEEVRELKIKLEERRIVGEPKRLN